MNGDWEDFINRLAGLPRWGVSWGANLNEWYFRVLLDGEIFDGLEWVGRPDPDEMTRAAIGVMTKALKLQDEWDAAQDVIARVIAWGTTPDAQEQRAARAVIETLGRHGYRIVKAEP